MSRYQITSKNPKLKAVVGWDGPMQTFYGQVFDPSIPEEQSDCIFWVGSHMGGVKTVEQLEKLMHEYAEFSAQERAQLQEDYEARTTPTGLQRLMLNLLENIEAKIWGANVRST
jgi:hypothetical protein